MPRRPSWPAAATSRCDRDMRFCLLDAGGEISICGPAHFTLLKSATAVTLALDYGRVHPSLDSPESFTIYTPTIIATPIAISGGTAMRHSASTRDGEMCILTARGAMRVEPQFSSQSLIVPQGGAANLEGGQIKSLPRDHHLTVRAISRGRASSTPSLCLLARSARSVTPRNPNRNPPMRAFQRLPALPRSLCIPFLCRRSVLMRIPLRPPPDPSPETILLVREVRLRPSVIFRGHVDPGTGASHRQKLLPLLLPQRQACRRASHLPSARHHDPHVEFLARNCRPDSLIRPGLQRPPHLSLFVTYFIDAHFTL